MRDPERRHALGAGGASRARERFGIEQVARDHLETYGLAKDRAVPAHLGARRLDDW